MIDILCLGHSAYDISYPLEEFPREDQKYVTRDSVEGGGGPAANAAYLLSLWRLSAGYGGLVGDDIYGRAIRKEFQAVGTDLRFLEVREGFQTPQSGIIINKENGSRTLINRRDADPAPVEFPDEVWRQAAPEVILMDGHYSSLGMKAMEMYPQALTILDGGSVHHGTSSLAPRVDYLIVSEAFALEFTGVPHLDSPENRKKALKALQEANGRYAVITRGEKGLLYKSPEEQGEMAAFPVRAVDTTGAGDIFHGAFAYCIYWGMDFQESLEFSSLTASLSVQKKGGRPSIPDLDTVLRAYEKLKGSL